MVATRKSESLGVRHSQAVLWSDIRELEADTEEAQETSQTRTQLEEWASLTDEEAGANDEASENNNEVSVHVACAHSTILYFVRATEASLPELHWWVASQHIAHLFISKCRHHSPHHKNI